MNITCVFVGGWVQEKDNAMILQQKQTLRKSIKEMSSQG
jgi:hypothetical protein